jgi:hypothetical protein
MKKFIPLLLAVTIIGNSQAQVSYIASDVQVTVALTAKVPLPAVPDINPETGKPDSKLPLVENASWTVSDKNSNPVSENSVSGKKFVSYKIDNLTILNLLVSEGIISSPKGYSITATFDSTTYSFTCHVVSKTDAQDINLNLNVDAPTVAYTISDVRNLLPNGDIRSMSHKGSSTVESSGAVEFGDLFTGVGLVTGVTTDFTWLNDNTDPTSLDFVTIPGAFKISGIVGSYNGVDSQGEPISGVIGGSISLAPSKSIRQTN